MDDEKKSMDDELKLLGESHEAEMVALAVRQNAVMARINAIFDKRRAEKLAGNSRTYEARTRDKHCPS